MIVKLIPLKLDDYGTASCSFLMYVDDVLGSCSLTFRWPVQVPNSFTTAPTLSQLPNSSIGIDTLLIPNVLELSSLTESHTINFMNQTTLPSSEISLLEME